MANGGAIFKAAISKPVMLASTPHAIALWTPESASQTMLAEVRMDGRNDRPSEDVFRVYVVRDRPVSKWLCTSLSEELSHGHGFLFLPVLLGAGAAIWFASPWTPSPFTLATMLAISMVTARLTRYRAHPLSRANLVLCMLLSGSALAALETWRCSTVVLDSPVTTTISGIVERREADAQRRWRYILRIEQTSEPSLSRPPQRVSVLARSQHEPADIGERVSGRARLSPPSGPALPGLNDFAFSSYFDQIGAVGFFYGAPSVQPAIDDQPGLWSDMQRGLFALRSAIGNRIRDTVKGDAGAFAAAIVTDERRAISRETTEALRLSGLAHIVAISGLNMALAAGIFFVGVRSVLSLFPGFAQAYPIKKFAAFGALVMATAYYLISGFGVSAERAYIMMAVMLVAVLVDRPSISLRNVALSAIIILAISPSEILGPSFQMSFAATAALVAGFALWTRYFAKGKEETKGSNRWITGVAATFHFIAGIVVTSLIGSTSTSIYSIEHFHHLTTYGLAANLAAMPIISFVVMPAGLVAMLLMPFGLDAPFLFIMGEGLRIVIRIAEIVAAWGGDIAIGRQNPLFLPLATAGFLLLTLLRTPLRLTGALFMAVALLFAVRSGSAPRPDIVISEDGASVGVIQDDKITLNRTRPPGFIYDQWRRALVLETGEQPLALPVLASSEPARGASLAKSDDRPPGPHSRPDLTRREIEYVRGFLQALKPGRFACLPKILCAAQTAQDIRIVTVEDNRYTGLACDVGRIIVSPGARFDTCRSGALLLSRRTLRRTGALEITIIPNATAPDIKITAAMRDSAQTSSRPWTVHRFYDWRTRQLDFGIPEAVAAHLRDDTVLNDSGE
ncbi:ComEC/Rec2 family competence protein [Neorhizobium sp. IRS_2294]|uniref:ComEC/Rec2 family competence protein n=1 Tax=unclassified Neorhizobium TaxID=2629175 RepID=UPI003D2A7124